MAPIVAPAVAPRVAYSAGSPPQIRADTKPLAAPASAPLVAPLTAPSPAPAQPDAMAKNATEAAMTISLLRNFCVKGMTFYLVIRASGSHCCQVIWCHELI
jgi:hypothetical protein